MSPGKASDLLRRLKDRAAGAVRSQARKAADAAGKQARKAAAAAGHRAKKAAELARRGGIGAAGAAAAMDPRRAGPLLRKSGRIVRDAVFPGKRRQELHKLLVRLAARAFGTAAALEALSRDFSGEGSTEVRKAARESRGLRDGIEDALRGVRMPSSERSDLREAAASIADMAEFAAEAAREMTLFRVPADRPMKEIVRILRAAAEDLAAGVEAMLERPADAAALAARAQKTADHAESLYRKAEGALVRKKEVVAVLKKRALYKHLSEAAARCERAAGRIGDILVRK